MKMRFSFEEIHVPIYGVVLNFRIVKKEIVWVHLGLNVRRLSPLQFRNTVHTSVVPETTPLYMNHEVYSP